MARTHVVRPELGRQVVHAYRLLPPYLSLSRLAQEAASKIVRGEEAVRVGMLLRRLLHPHRPRLLPSQAPSVAVRRQLRSEVAGVQLARNDGAAGTAILLRRVGAALCLIFCLCLLVEGLGRASVEQQIVPVL